MSRLRKNTNSFSVIMLVGSMLVFFLVAAIICIKLVFAPYSIVLEGKTLGSSVSYSNWPVKDGSKFVRYGDGYLLEVVSLGEDTVDVIAYDKEDGEMHSVTLEYGEEYDSSHGVYKSINDARVQFGN